MRKFLVFLIAFTAALSGCSDDNSSAALPPSPTPQPRPQKPLPPCEDQVTVELQGAESTPARKRTIQIGYRAGSYFYHRDLYEGDVVPPLSLDRDVTYHVVVSTQKVDGNSDYYVGTIYVPTCDERQAYQDAHPEYEEPILLSELK